MRTQQFLTFMSNGEFVIVDIERGLASHYASYVWRPQWTAVSHFLCSVSVDRYVYWRTAENITMIDLENAHISYMCPYGLAVEGGYVWRPSKMYFGGHYSAETCMSAEQQIATVYSYYSDMKWYEKVYMTTSLLWKKVMSHVHSLRI